MNTRNESRPWFRLPIFGKIIAGYTVLGGVLLITALCLSINLSVEDMQENMQNTLMSTAESLAASQWVVEAVTDMEINPTLSDYLDTLIEQNEDISLITIANTQSQRIYHYHKERIGQYFVGGDEDRALAGESYFSDAVGTAGLQHRAFTPIRGEDGQVVGFIMVSTMMARLERVQHEIGSAFLRTTIVLLPIALMLAIILSASIRSDLMGYAPDQLVRTFLTQEDVLDALDEGLLSVAKDGTILFANGAARRMLDDSDVQGKRLLTYLDEGLSAIVAPDKPVYNRETTIRGVSVLYDCLPPRGKGQGVTLILRNKTEATRLAEELTGTRHMVTALRANTHDFMNKLHVIWGLLCMDQVQEACSYISHISELQEESISPIIQLIENPTVAGLILGKISHMRETDISLTLNRSSHLPPHSQFLSTRRLVTILGNLIENAIEAINEQPNAVARKIELQITEHEKCLLIWIDDTGVGIAPGETEKIFIPGYSTKGKGRGVGMGLIRDIVQSVGGTIEVESESGVGTSVTIVVNRPREGSIIEPPGNPI